jgi:hypothetical protein
VRRSNIIMGIALIIFGILFFFDSLYKVSYNIGDFWPIFIMLIGVSFLVSFWHKRSNSGVLMPGTILTVYGLMFFISTLSGWHNMAQLWPGFLLGPGLGFALMYYFGSREKGLLIPAFILILLALIFWSSVTFLFKFWPVILILFGIYLIRKGYLKYKQASHE